MELVPSPKSSFLRVKCPECEEEMIVFDHAKTRVECNNETCDHVVVVPQTGKALIDAEIIEKLS